MKIAILCGNYYPNYSAVGLCASRLAESYAKSNEVFVLSVTDVIQGDTQFSHNGVAVYKDIPLIERKRKNAIKKEYKYAWIKNCIVNYYRFIRMTNTVCSKYSIRSDYVDSFYRLIDKIQDIDLIIALCMPIESVYAAMKYRKDNNKNYKIIMMMYDGFADARTTHYFTWNKKRKFNRHIKLENEIFSACEKVCYVAQNKEHLMKYHKELISRFVEVEHPNIQRKECPKKLLGNFSDDKVHFVYGGGLKKDYIDPTYFVKLLSMLPNVKLDIFTSENALRQFQDFNDIDSVCMRGWLSQEQLTQVLYEADFLINFATKDGHQISSKIFEYISMGRPFVHVYSSDSDNNLKYLKNYPLVLCLNENDDDDYNARTLIKWCEDNKGKNISFDEIMKDYYECTPEYICNQIIEGVE